MASVDERVASLETKSALQDVKIEGLATAAMLAEMRQEMNKGLSDLRLSIEKRFGAVENRLTAIETMLPSLATKAEIYVSIGGALVLGLGAAFEMFKYMIPH